MIRNIFGVSIGILVALAIVTFAINIDPNWIEYEGGFIFKHWQKVVKSARDEFFIALLISEGVGSMIGGIVTALIVKEAKTAYAMLIGFLLFIAALFDIIFTTDHPTFYEIGIFFVFFPFSWLGGKIVDLIYKNWFVRATKN